MSISFALIDPSEGWREGETEKEKGIVDVAMLDAGGASSSPELFITHTQLHLSTVWMDAGVRLHLTHMQQKHIIRRAR